MSRTEGISASELSRMKERLAQIEEQVRSTRLEFNDGVTVRNSTGRSLQLTLNITERNCFPVDVRAGEEELTLNSTFKLPNNTALSHHFSRNGREYFNHTSQKDNESSDRTRDLHSSPSRNAQREEQKFQSSGSRKKIEEETKERPVTANDHKIKIEEEEDGSDIEEESRVRPISASGPHEKETISHHKSAIDHENQVSTDMDDPHHVSTHPRIQNSTKKLESVTPSPQVYSYINQQYRTHHPEINTSFKKQSYILQKIDPKMITPLKIRTQQHDKHDSTHKRLSQIRAVSRQASAAKPHHLQSISIHPETHQKDNNTSSKMKKTWVVVRNQQTRSKSKSHFQSNKVNKGKPKAEQLYKQRKQPFTATKSSMNDASRHKMDVDKRFNRFVTATRAANDHSLSKRSLSPKIQALTGRLSSRQRSPCGHYRLYSESKERQSFLRLIEQNPVACKYIGNEEREHLFQQLRNDSDSVSLWPMKIVNYTYAKLKNSCSVNYAVLKE